MAPHAKRQATMSLGAPPREAQRKTAQALGVSRRQASHQLPGVLVRAGQSGWQKVAKAREGKGWRDERPHRGPLRRSQNLGVAGHEAWNELARHLAVCLAHLTQHCICWTQLQQQSCRR